jgi:hypothetical protein
MLTWDRLRLWPMDANTRAVLCGVQTEDILPGHFLRVTEPLCYCRTHWWIAFGDGASCWFSSYQNPCWVSVMDPVWINSSTARTHTHTHTHILLLPNTPCRLTSKVTTSVRTPVCNDNLAEKRIITILKFFTISTTTCILATCWGGTMTWFGMPLVPDFSRWLK